MTDLRASRRRRLTVLLLVLALVVAVVAMTENASIAVLFVVVVALVLALSSIAASRLTPRVRCPYCDERIPSSALVCRYCRLDISNDDDRRTGRRKPCKLPLIGAGPRGGVRAVQGAVRRSATPPPPSP
jgi:hypothetical protein